MDLNTNGVLAELSLCLENEESGIRNGSRGRKAIFIFGSGESAMMSAWKKFTLPRSRIDNSSPRLVSREPVSKLCGKAIAQNCLSNALGEANQFRDIVQGNQNNAQHFLAAH